MKKTAPSGALPEPPGSGPGAGPLPHGGHRARLRSRFLRTGLAGMLDYEVLEFMLMIVIPRKDVKPLAKQLLERFGSITNVLDAPLEALMEVSGVGASTGVALKFIRELCGYCLTERCKESKDLMKEPEDAWNLVRMKLGANFHESYMMLYLNSRKELIDYRMIAEGTVDHVFAYVRNAAEMALKLHATAAIMVHNHPSGSCEPSTEDLAVTNEMYFALYALGVELVDHLVVTRTECFSFIQHGIRFQNRPPGVPERTKRS